MDIYEPRFLHWHDSVTLLRASLGPWMPIMNGQDDVLFGYIAAKQWKQALKTCEKKLKASPASDFLLVTKISILVQWPDAARFEQGHHELIKLVERKPPVADIESLRALDTVISYLGPRIDIDPKQKQTWQRAATSRPQDERLHETWYRIKFAEKNFKGAQQACMTWMKNFPNERKPFFLYVLNTHLASNQTPDRQEKSLMQTLAYRTISKAVKATQDSNGDSSGSGRRIDTYEDLVFLLRVYLAADRQSEAVEIIQHPRVGFPKYVGAHKWQLVLRYLDLLVMQQRWGNLRHVCLQILEESSHSSPDNTLFGLGKLGNDFKIWSTIIQANANDRSTQDLAAVEDMIRSLGGTSRKTSERTARMAQLAFFSLSALERPECQDSLLTTIINYFEDFSTKIPFFKDIWHWISLLDTAKQKQLLLHAAQFSRNLRPLLGKPPASMVYWITCEINVLKLEYNLVISQDRNSQNVKLLVAFITNCFRLYKESFKLGVELPVSDRRPGDDAALLAAMGLIRLFKLGRKSALLQCIVILEHSLLQSKHNYDAILILVRLYIFLGAGSLAMERYSKLSIKNLQHSTLSWVLYTRISSIHPYPCTFIHGKSHLTIDPLEDLLQASKWHTSAQAISMRAVHNMQANGQWNMSLESLETHQAVVDSFAKYLLFVEGKRIARIRSCTYELPAETIVMPNQTNDQRDRSAFPDFEGGDLSFECHLPTAGTSLEPNNAWLQQQLSIALFWDILHNKGEGWIYAERDEAAKQKFKKEPDARTNQEHALSYMVSALSVLRSLWSVKDSHEKEAQDVFIQDLLDSIEEWLIKCSKGLASNDASKNPSAGLTTLSWSLFHDLFTHLEMCKFILPAMEYAASENKKSSRVGQVWLTDRVEVIRKECFKLADTVHQVAKGIQHKVLDQATLEEIEAVVLGDLDGVEDGDAVASELRNLGDYVEMKQMCRDIRDSWRNGLEGVIRTTIA